MRRLAAFSMIMALAAMANGQMLREGTQELFGSFSLDPDNAAGNTSWNVDLGYGYFVVDNVEVGGILGYQDINLGASESETVRIGAFGEYNWPIEGTMWVPAVGLTLAYADIDAKGGIEDAFAKDDAFEATIRPAIKYFISEAIAIDTGLDLRWASEDIYINDGELEDTDWGISARVRAHF